MAIFNLHSSDVSPGNIPPCHYHSLKFDTIYKPELEFLTHSTREANVMPV